MIDLDNTAELIPTDQWVYNLYKVSYWSGEPELGGKLISTMNLACTDSHIGGDANEYAPARANWMNWEVVKENVGQPRVVGRVYGQNLYEGSRDHARRLV